MRFETRRNRCRDFRTEEGASLDCMDVGVPERGRYLNVNGSERSRALMRNTSLLSNEVWGYDMSLHANRILSCDRGHNTGAMAPMRRECLEIYLLDNDEHW